MYFRQLHDEADGWVSYLLADLKAGEGVLIDPRAADLPVLQAMLAEHRLHLHAVLRTHEHDKACPAEWPALRALGVTVVQHGTPAAARGGVGFGGEHLRVLRTPGHTAGCLSFQWRDRVFCGGLFAADACPVQPRPAQPEALWHSVTQVVFALPPETLLFGSHATRGRVVSQVAEQRRWHPWFGRASRDEFLGRLRQQPARPVQPSPMPS